MLFCYWLNSCGLVDVPADNINTAWNTATSHVFQNFYLYKFIDLFGYNRSNIMVHFTRLCHPLQKVLLLPTKTTMISPAMATSQQRANIAYGFPGHLGKGILHAAKMTVTMLYSPRTEAA